MKHTPGPWEIEGPIGKPGEMLERGYQIIKREPDGANDWIVAVTGNRAAAELIANVPIIAELLDDLLNPENAVEPIRREAERILRRIYENGKRKDAE